MQIHRLSQRCAAELLGVTPRALRDWHDAPRNEDGTYPGPALVAWFLDRRPPEGEYDDQRQRLAAAQAEKIERELAVQAGELARKSDVLREWTAHIGACRARLLRLPADCGAKVPPEVRGLVQCLVRDGVHEALVALAQHDGAR